MNIPDTRKKVNKLLGELEASNRQHKEEKRNLKQAKKE